MTSSQPSPATLTSKAYAALRHGGAPPRHAQAQLGLPPRLAARLERLFLIGHDPLRPKFARHAAHVRRVLVAGGYPCLPERHR